MNFPQFAKKISTQLNLLIFFELVSVFLMSAGFAPREFSLFLLVAILIFIIFSPSKDGLKFFVFSIPFFVSLAISDSFDSMASWRVILLILFIKSAIIFWKDEVSGPAALKGLSAGLFKSRLFLLIAAFFLIGFTSLLVAEEPIYGIKKMIYLANIFALFFIVYMIVKSKKDALDVLKFSFAGSLGALLIGYGQFISTLFFSLYSFWKLWASHVIPVFYGKDLSELLTYSNTWFSYYEGADATLRMFSVFPDSHSFALSMLLSVPIALAYFLSEKKYSRGKFALGALAALYLMSMIFSGTRGVWLGAAPVFIACLVFMLLAWKRDAVLKIPFSGILKPLFKARRYAKVGIISVVFFFMLFPAVSQFLQVSQMLQGGKISSDSTFERISTSLSKRELSNKGRIDIWESTFESISKKPWLGVGMGNYPVVLGENISATKEGASAHSLYLDVIAEMGIFAGILLLLIFFEIFWRSVKAAISVKDRFLSLFSGLFAVYFLWFMAYSVVDVVLLNDKVLLFFTALVALIYRIPIRK